MHDRGMASPPRNSIVTPTYTAAQHLTVTGAADSPKANQDRQLVLPDDP
jgi:hypothetical protein